MSRKKVKKLYQVRFERGSGMSTKQVGHKMRLLDRHRAARVVMFLQERGVDAFMAPLTLYV